MTASTHNFFKIIPVFGKELTLSVDIPEGILNQLFAALFLSQLLVFIGGNAVVRHSMVLENSAWIALACIQVVAVFYMLTRMLKSVSWGLLATYGLMLLMVYSRFNLREETGLAVGIVGVLYVLRFLRVSRTQIPAILLMAVLTSLAILGTQNAYTSFDMVSRIHAGNVNQDTLFHASIAAMIKNYGVVSTGLHGLVETPYHALSHALMAGVSILSHQSIIETYGVANWVLFAPILILAIAATCAALDSERVLSTHVTWSLAALVLLLAPGFLEKWAVWDSYFVSESYLVSLGLFMMALPVLFKRKITITDLVFVLAASFLISGAKSTVGLIYAGLWLARLLFVRGDRPGLEMIGFGFASTVAGAIVLKAAQAHSSGIGFKLFEFLSYSRGGEAAVRFGESLQSGAAIGWRDLGSAFLAIAQFGLFHFLFTWILVGVIVFRLGARGIFQTPIAVYSLAAAFAGVLATINFSISGGAVYYISNVAFFVAMPGVITYMAAALPERHESQRRILVALLVVAMIGSASAIRNSVIRANYDGSRPESQLVQALSTLRTASPLEAVYRYQPKEFTALPVENCTTQPFFFPAVSERAWVGIIRPKDGCNFINYSYEQYGLRPDRQKVTVDPKLLSGMRIVDFGS